MKIISWLFICSFFLAACGAPAPSPTGLPSNPGYPTQAKTTPTGAYPAAPPKSILTPTQPGVQPYPPRATVVPTQISKDPGDSVKGPVFIDETGIIKVADNPAKYQLKISGNRPTPCHELQYRINPPDKDKKIIIGVYTLVKSGQICPQVLSPFSLSIDLGTIPVGEFSVYANEIKAGTVKVP
jgi:hypothetical protein